MPAPLPLPVRGQILRLHQRGVSLAGIAAQLHCSTRSVARVLAQHRRQPDGVPAPRYDHAPHRCHPLSEPQRQHVYFLATQHPTWGAPFLRTVLQQQQPDVAWPSARTLQRWLGPARGLPASPIRASSPYQRATQPHAVWQVDATDQLPLRTAQQVSWLRVVDECSGAFLQTRVFPPRPLQSSGPAPGPSRAAAHVQPLGPAGGRAGGQRQSVGQFG